MWECPNMLHFGSYDALIFCPQGLEAREFDRQNIYQAGYIAGHLSLDSMDMMQHTKFQELDHGFDFYAEYSTSEKGWMYSLTLPRVLTLRQGHIFSRPAAELKALRIESTAIDIDADMESSILTRLFDGSEVLLDITLGKAQKVTMFVDKVLSLQMFVDRAAVEAFFQHGEDVASMLVFPEKNIRPELRIEADAALETVTGRVWELDAFRFNP